MAANVEDVYLRVSAPLKRTSSQDVLGSYKLSRIGSRHAQLMDAAALYRKNDIGLGHLVSGSKSDTEVALSPALTPTLAAVPWTNAQRYFGINNGILRCLTRRDKSRIGAVTDAASLDRILAVVMIYPYG